MRIVLAGALGEVGASLMGALTSRNHDIVAVSSRAPLVEAPSVISLAEAEDVIASGQVDALVNASGPGDRRRPTRDVHEPADQLARIASRSGTPAVLISTARVLEGHSGMPSDNAHPAPETPYARANADLEGSWLAHRDTHVLRMANFFCAPAGPRTPQAELLPWSLLLEGLHTGHIDVRSHAQATKDFVSAHDVARAIEYVIMSVNAPRVLATSPGARLTMFDLAEASGAALRVTGRSAPSMSFGQKRTTSDPPSVGWLNDQGWTSEISLAQMIETMAQWLIEWGPEIQDCESKVEGR